MAGNPGGRLCGKDMTIFESLTNAVLAQALGKRGIIEPTPVQAEAIPLLAGGRDVIASSETGSGKTLAYLLPIVCKIDPAIRAAQAVVLVPTHELAAQVCREAEQLLAEAGLSCSAALIIGGANIQRQLDALKAKPVILVGSVGRLNELAEMRKLKLHEVRTVVLDEGDRLLDKDNHEAVRAFIRRTLADRQLALFSASVSEKTEEIARTIMRDPAVLRLRPKTELPKGIRHIAVAAGQREKAALLRKIFHAEKIKKGIVFVNNPFHVVNAAERLRRHGVPCAALYGNAFPNERRQALDDFRAGRAALLVASDMAARGLDIQGLTHVINLDMPEQAASYLHRAGRTGRMGADGTVVTLATPRELELLGRYAKQFGFETETQTVAEGKLADDESRPGRAPKPRGMARKEEGTRHVKTAFHTEKPNYNQKRPGQTGKRRESK